MNADVAAELRDQLKPFQHRRIEVEGTVSRVSTVFDHKARREVPSLCFNNLEIREGDHRVIDHVWVTWATLMQNAGVREGDTVRFTAQVYSYQHRDPEDHNKFFARLGLREPRGFVCLNRTLEPVKPETESNGKALLDDLRKVMVKPEAEEEPELELPPPPSPMTVRLLPADPRRELLDAVWSLADRFGIDKVKKMVGVVETLIAE